MPTLADLRTRLPDLNGLDDSSAVYYIQQVYYPNVEASVIADKLGIKPADKPPKSPGALGHLADTGLQLAQGVLQGGEMLANTFGADNPVSSTLRKGHEWLASNFSDQLKWEQLTTAREMEEAAQSGSTWEEVKAAARGFGRDPVGYLVNAAGTSLPTIAAAFLPGGQGAVLGRLAAMGAAGAAQGAGATKGQIYQEVKDVWKQAGASDEEAQARASAAQEYLGSNAGQIAIGTALGAIAGGTGLEGSLATKGIAQKLAKPTGMIPRFVKEGFKEAIPEAMQGGQEQLAANLAVQNEGFERSTWGGVAGGMTLEGMAGGLVGAASSPFTKRPEAKPDPIKEIAEAPTVDAAIVAAQKAIALPAPAAKSQKAIALPAPAAKSEWEVVDGMLGLPAPKMADEVLALPAPTEGPAIMVDSAGTAAVQPAAARAEALTRQAEHDLQVALERSGRQRARSEMADLGLTPDVLAAQYTREQGERVIPREDGPEITPRRKTDAVDLGIAPSEPIRRGADLVTAYVEQRRNDGTPAGLEFARDFDAGRIKRKDVESLIGKPPASPDERLAAAAAQAPKPAEDGLLLTADGKSYGTRSAAVVRARREGLPPSSVIEVADGYAVRLRSLPANGASAPKTSDGDSASEQSAIDGGTGTVGSVADDAIRGVDGDPGAAAAGSGSGVPAGRDGGTDGALTAESPDAQPATVMGQTEEQRRAAIDAETMEDRPEAPEVAQPIKGKRIKVFARTLNGINEVTANLYDVPGYKGPQLAVKEYKTSRGQGYRVYLPKSGAFIHDSNGVSTLEETLNLAVLRIKHARDTIASRAPQPNAAPPLSERVAKAKAKKKPEQPPVESAPDEKSTATLQLVRGEKDTDAAAPVSTQAPAQAGATVAAAPETETAKNADQRHADARRIGREAAERGEPRDPPSAFTSVEKQIWRAGWDAGKATKKTPQVPAPAAAPIIEPEINADSRPAEQSPSLKERAERRKPSPRVDGLKALLQCLTS